MTPDEPFTLTERHLTLLRNSYVSRYLSGDEYGAAEIDAKRPYGNSDVFGDIARLLGAPPEAFDEEDQLRDEWRARAKRIHEQTPTALQIVLSTGRFEPGVYAMTSPFNARSWTKLRDIPTGRGVS